MALPDSPNLFAVMPGYLGEPRALGAKILALYPGNPQAGLSSHIGLVVHFDPDTGVPRAVMDASEITAIRTAAASAVATRALARDDARVLAILGTGEQAGTHIEALAQVRPLSIIRIWGRSGERAQALAARHAHLPVRIEVCGTARAAAEGADIICTLTASPEPILEGQWLEPGTHVNLVGASRRNAREADDEVVARSRFFVDLKASALAEAGEWYHAQQAGRVGEAHILAEIGEVLEGRAAGRITSTDVTVYKSVGMAAQDLASAQAIYERALIEGIGTHVPF
jgi:ornithine cyclodeaminase